MQDTLPLSTTISADNKATATEKLVSCELNCDTTENVSSDSLSGLRERLRSNAVQLKLAYLQCLHYISYFWHAS